MPNSAARGVSPRGPASLARSLLIAVVALLAAVAAGAVAAAPAHAVAQGGTCTAFSGAYQLNDGKGHYAAYADSSVTVPACGPEPGYGGGPRVYAYPGAPWTEGYQCVEFSDRFIYYKYGLTAPAQTNGDQIVDHFAAKYPDKFDVRTAADKKPLVQGDVLSFAHSSNFNDSSGGHTAVVQSSSIGSDGTGWVTVVEQNSAQAGQATFKVDGWGITNSSGYKYVKWLHFRATPTPPTTGGGSGSSGAGGAKKVDVVFAIDTTGSMSPYINSVVQSASSIVNTLSAAHADYRVGVVDYKDSDYGCSDYDAVKDLDFSTSASAIQSTLSGLVGKVSGGCDTPEDVYSGIHLALGFPWRSGVTKAVIFMGDAPGHDPEPHSGLTLAAIKAEAFAVDPAQVYPVLVGSDTDAHSFDQALADATGGQSFDATSDPTAAGAAFVTAIDAILGTLQPTQTVVTPGAVTAPAGAPVTLDAQVTPAVDGGSVAFISDGDPILGCQGATVDPSGHATCTTWFATAGTRAITAVYSGDGTFDTSAAPAAPLTITGTCVSTPIGTSVVPPNGTLCLGPTAVVRGPLAVGRGGSLYIQGAAIRGAVMATSPNRVVICGSSVGGALSVRGATGLVTVGDLDGAPSCAGNTVDGPLTLDSNRAGVQASDNTVRGVLVVTRTSGVLPAPDTGAADVQDNRAR